MSKPLQPLPEFVFRGTTYNFEGGEASVSEPFRCCTTINPLKAFYFAKVCHAHYGNAVVYVAASKKLVEQEILTIPPNIFGEIEEEIIWVVKPRDFYKHSEGYVTWGEIRDALISIGRQPNFSANSLGEISLACRDKTSDMNVNEIRKLLKILTPLLKYP